MIYLDTHVVVWLHTQIAGRLSHTAAQKIERSLDLRVSPMVRLELQYLYEIGRANMPPAPVLDNLWARLGLTVCQASFAAVAVAAEGVQWTRDPFDRLIVAQALLHKAPLITNDHVIRQHYADAIW
jgi:PIN domain nuclease of toxin-antitoxin system